MLFNSQNFILIFLPFFLLSYHLARDNFKNTIILVYSILFYLIGNYNNLVNIIVFLLMIIVNYIFCNLIIKYKEESSNISKNILIASVVLNILVLCFFKSNLIYKSIPLGLSFYIFHFISILVDIYKCDSSRDKFNGETFINYVVYFPKVLSGPITRFDYFVSRYKTKNFNSEMILRGLLYFAVGLSLKCILSDNIAYIINQINVYGFDSISIGTAWIGMYSYTMRLYYDFAGYSLMAIGLANLMGMDLPVNFNLPFCSKSVSEFWRRWHITLGHFFRDYLYIPLGGNFNNRNKFRQSLNLIIVWFITGMWHGFKMNYILWAMIICFIIILEKLYVNKIFSKYEIIGLIVVNIVMPFAFLFFSLEDLSQLRVMIYKLFDFKSLANARDLQVIISQYGRIFIIGIIFMTKYPRKLIDIIMKNKIVLVVVSVILILVSLYMMNITNSDAFKYFTF